MATQSSELDDQKSGATIQMEGHTLTPLNGWNGPKEMEASGSTKSHSPSPVPGKEANAWLPWDQVLFGNSSDLDQRRRSYTTPNMPGRHQWWKTCSKIANLVSPEAVVMGPGWAVLFYRRQSLGEGLSLGETQDTMFTLSGAISWFGKQALLNANALSL